MFRFVTTLALAALALEAAACSCSTNRLHPDFDAGPDDAASATDMNRTLLPDMNIMQPDFGPVTHCGATPTTITGTTLAPNMMDPLPGLVVAAFPNDHVFSSAPTTVQCTTCVSGVPGALAFTTSGADGTFTLMGSPLDGGGTVTIVVISGGFRRVVRNVTVPMCGTLALTAAQTSLPGATSGDDLIPRIAVASVAPPAGGGTATGDVNDKFAHVLDAIGITGYTRFGPDKTATSHTPPDLITLMSSANMLSQYDVVIAPCGSLGNYAVWNNGSGPLSSAMVTNLQTWLGQGGRLYASDLSYEVVAQVAPSAITWAAGPSSHAGADPADVGMGVATATINANVDDPGLLAWLQLVGAASAGSMTIPITDFRDPWGAIDSVPAANLMADSHGAHHETVFVSGDVTWHTAGSGHHPLTVQADVADPSGNYCGRVVFSSYHVQTGTAGQPLSPQERVLEYLFFQLSTCIDLGPM
jgi:hypothetical protein